MLYPYLRSLTNLVLTFILLPRLFYFIFLKISFYSIIMIFFILSLLWYLFCYFL
ncbi:hypothetical protein BDV27DRAFT_5457 [Aspergillus caelatus]|uniref:Uncharacterized protein n=1 Tax=Aspergillus caelatus TaxID=61420 RepID=A0A5N7AL77_9EURO|nr:uncharacterized protein BDV27DRAFT_5457 [Aspergillus caelatus]KAE8369460.1 hypothetical protein BDV27DRAFT_5457 [Aspergillus caelatus]